jgi:hypothetical protein
VETGSEQQLQLCGPIQLVRVDFAHDHTLLSIRPAPAAVVVAGFRSAAAETPAIRGGTPSYRRFPPSPRCTIGSTGVSGGNPAEDDRSKHVRRDARSRPEPRTAPACTPLTCTDGRHRRSDTASPPRISTPPGRPRGSVALAPPRFRGPARAADGDGRSAALSQCVVDAHLFDAAQPRSAVNHMGVIRQFVTESGASLLHPAATRARRNRRMCPFRVLVGRHRPTGPAPRRRPRRLCPDALACGSE